ncbi:tRNA threonylcarbamoyladenosine dehydratase [Candidatus Vallotiella sp. (ex Adelges kitamiensis)]|uniref:tRNA threonylcarbamoyladenosine dehydratase n=1 Tax=Candidatus Vallotiella sp. (ex Adelges kitamiensis) TaxID=2864217 RepID=UPI001CE2DA06|nr:tRNA threonylcarbamoyladenosine dehydratase [Candidatus Vallotia sp. (ex Adelges kitamiensis)]
MSFTTRDPNRETYDLASETVEFETEDYPRRFSGVARLYGDAALQKFEHSHVTIVGIGGVGSWVAEALARSAIGHLTLIDMDHVSKSNTNRQIQAINTNYGKSKVYAMTERIRAIHPRCVITQVDDFIDSNNLDVLLDVRCNFIVDAIDSVCAKTELIAWCIRRRVPIVTVGGAGGQLDPTRIHIDDLACTTQDPLLCKVRSRLRKHHGFPRQSKERFNVRAVYSDEPLIYPQVAACDLARSAASGLHCAGFGSSVCVTGSFGFSAAAYVLNALTSSHSQTSPRFSA